MLPASVVTVIVHLFAQHFDASEIAGCHPFHQFNTMLLILAGCDEVIFSHVDRDMHTVVQNLTILGVF
jgi:hypothetical protein